MHILRTNFETIAYFTNTAEIAHPSIVMVGHILHYTVGKNALKNVLISEIRQNVNSTRQENNASPNSFEDILREQNFFVFHSQSFMPTITPIKILIVE